MKRMHFVLCTLAVVVLLALTTGAFAQTDRQVIYIGREDGDKVFANEAPEAPYAIEGMENWAGQSVVDDVCYTFTIQAGAPEMPLHDSGEGYWLGQVATGGGTLLIEKASGQEEIPMKAGDYMVIPPNSSYGWKPGTEETEFVLIAIKDMK